MTILGNMCRMMRSTILYENDGDGSDSLYCPVEACPLSLRINPYSSIIFDGLLCKITENQRSL